MTISTRASLAELVVHTATVGTAAAGAAYVYAVLNPNVTLQELQPMTRNIALGALALSVAARIARPRTQPQAMLEARDRAPVHKDPRRGSIAPLILAATVTGISTFIIYYKNA